MKALVRLFAQEAPAEFGVIAGAAALAGILSGLLIPLMLQAGQEILAGRWYRRYLLLLPLMAGILLVMKWHAQKWTAALSEKTLAKLLRQLCETLRQAELRDIEQLDRTALLLAAVNAQEVTQALMKAVNVFTVLLALFVSWLQIVRLAPQAGFLILLAFALAQAAYKVFQALTHHAVVAEAGKQQALFASFRHLLYGFKELKSDPRKSAALFDDELRPLIAENQAIRAQTAGYFAEYHLFTDICQYAAMGSIALLLPAFGLQSVVATIFAIMMYQGKLILVMLAQLPDIIKGQIALNQLQQFTAPQRSIPLLGGAGVGMRPASFRTLTLQDIRFTYPERHGVPGFAIGPLSLTVQAGEILFIIGGNGSGKSTLMSVLTGLYPPTAGVVTLDGRRVKLADCRPLFAAVFSDAHVFDRLYGLPHVDPAQVQALLQQMDLARRVRYADGRFSTRQLSTGQQRRLALLTALLEAKPIYVFDEWAASQTPDFRQYFYAELLPALKAQGKTVIVVSHDDHYFAAADRLIKMEYGQIVTAPGGGEHA